MVTTSNSEPATTTDVLAHLAKHMFRACFAVFILFFGMWLLNGFHPVSPVGAMQRQADRLELPDGYERVQREIAQSYFCWLQCPSWGVSDVYRSPVGARRDDVCRDLKQAYGLLVGETPHDYAARFNDRYRQSDTEPAYRCFYSVKWPFGTGWNDYAVVENDDSDLARATDGNDSIDDGRVYLTVAFRRDR